MHDLIGWLIDIESLYNIGYEMIDGLRFKDGAYINTEFRGTNGFGFDCSVRVDETNPDVSGYANYQAIGATRKVMTHNANMFAAINGAFNSIIFSTGSYTNAWNYNIGEEHFYEGRFVSGGSNYLKVDGEVMGGPFIVSWTLSNNANEDICIAKNSVSETIMGIVNIYDTSSNLVRKLSPAKRTADGKFGYFDILHGNFYPNVGGGTIEGIGSSDDEEWEWIFTKSTTNILRRNFPEKFGEIVAYAKRHPQIVPFINEDPMLTCSLGIEGMPIRWLVGDGTAYIDTDYHPNNNTKVHCIYKLRSGGTKIVYGVSDESPSATRAYGMLKIYDNPNRYGFGYVNGTTIDSNYGSVIGRKYDIIQDKNELYLDGTKILTMPASTWQTQKTLWLYGRNGGTPFYSDDCKAVFEIWDGDIKSANMVPSIHENQNGLYDIERKQWFGNSASSGAFTISYTLQDGVTPWQPYT